MTVFLITLFILLALLVLILAIFFAIYNGLVSKRITSENAWSQISIQLKRRHDLIPNLVETVKGYATHEQATLEKVIKARNVAVTAGEAGNIAETGKAENMLTGALRQIFALSENYPDLKANQSYLQLQEELTSTENRISFSRQHYNDSVSSYNTAVEQVPSNIVAIIAGFKKKDFFELDASEAEVAKAAPKVSF